MAVTLLGPQRQTDTARVAVAELITDGPVATINAGWREREDDTAELGEVLGGRMLNLRLWRRWRAVLDTDPDYAVAERALRERISAQQEVYGIRLGFALDALRVVERWAAGVPAATSGPAAADALTTVRRLDEWHQSRVRELRQDFYAEVGLGERPVVQQHRTEVAEVLADAAGVVLTGGHVGALLQTLHVFDVAPLLRGPIVAWSAGAMVLGDVVILFNDFSPTESPGPQVYAEGLGLVHRVLPFPHAGRRLRLSDHDHLRRIARRFSPHRCLLLEAGARVDLGDGGALPTAGRLIGSDGSVVDIGARSTVNGRPVNESTDG